MSKGINISAYWMHEQFSPLAEHSESLSVVKNSWKTLVIDCPDRSINSLINDDVIESGCQSHIDYLLITHIDSDHISWLPKILWYKHFWEKTRLKLIAHPNIKELLWRAIEWWFNQDRTKSYPSPKKFEDYIDFIPLSYWEEIELDDAFKIKSFSRSTKHSPNMDVLAIKVFDMAWNDLANFSADTAFDPELIDFLSEWTWPIIHELWAYVERWSHSHTSIKEYIEWVSEKVQARTFFNHIPAMKEQEIRQVIKESNSPAQFAEVLYPESVSILIEKVKSKVTLREVLFSWSYDPFTMGHLSQIRQHLEMNRTDKVTVMIAVNPEKKGMFNI